MPQSCDEFMECIIDVASLFKYMCSVKLNNEEKKSIYAPTNVLDTWELIQPIKLGVRKQRKKGLIM